MTFTEDWFSNKIHVFKKFLPNKNIDILEIGSFEGMSALWMLKNLEPNRIVLIEPGLMKGDNNKLLKENLNGLKYDLIEDKTPDAFKSIVFHKFDFIYIDGDHSSRGCLFDMIVGWNLLRPNGIMAIDDYKWNRKHSDGTCPAEAIDYFLLNNTNYQILENSYQVWLKKTK